MSSFKLHSEGLPDEDHCDRYDEFMTSYEQELHSLEGHRVARVLDEDEHRIRHETPPAR